MSSSVSSPNVAFTLTVSTGGTMTPSVSGDGASLDSSASGNGILVQNLHPGTPVHITFDAHSPSGSPLNLNGQWRVQGSSEWLAIPEESGDYGEFFRTIGDTWTAASTGGELDLEFTLTIEQSSSTTITDDPQIILRTKTSK